MRFLLIILAITTSLCAAPVPKPERDVEARRQAQAQVDRLVQMMLEDEAAAQEAEDAAWLRRGK